MRKHSAFAVICGHCKRLVEIPENPGPHPCPKCGGPLAVIWEPLTIPAPKPKPDRAALHSPGRAQCLRPPALSIPRGVK
jgi:hypothetical protein